MMIARLALIAVDSVFFLLFAAISTGVYIKLSNIREENREVEGVLLSSSVIIAILTVLNLVYLVWK